MFLSVFFIIFFGVIIMVGSCVVKRKEIERDYNVGKIVV